KEQESYWQNQFEDEVPVLNLPTDYPRPAIWSFEGNTTAFELTKDDTTRLRQKAVEKDTTLFMVLLTIHNIMLSKLSGQETIVIGTPVMGRPHADLQTIIGIFINTLALKNKPSGEKTVTEFLAEVGTGTLEALENQEYPFENLVDTVAGITRDTGRNPLFDVMFSVQEMEGGDVTIPGLTLKPYAFETRTSKFDITVICKPKADTLHFSVEYSTKLFKPVTIGRIVGYFKKLVSELLSDTAKKISELEIMPEEEKHRLLVEFNSGAAGYPVDKSIVTLFAEQVEKQPRNTVVTG
ncbi:MAG: non-ribosomal peptide synthetase, partial [bacterium]|nr:non-ribosomal peptide synthetase [bacterium]